jgi:hypothetical protein
MGHSVYLHGQNADKFSIVLKHSSWNVPLVFDLKGLDRRNQFISLTVRRLVSVGEKCLRRLSNFLVYGCGSHKDNVSGSVHSCFYHPSSSTSVTTPKTTRLAYPEDSLFPVGEDIEASNALMFLECLLEGHEPLPVEGNLCGHSDLGKGGNGEPRIDRQFRPLQDLPPCANWAADPTFRSTSLNSHELLLTVRELSVSRG